MESRTEVLKFRALMVAVVFFLGSALASFDEFMLTAFGTETTATVAKVSHVTSGSRFGGGSPRLLVTATWSEPNGTLRRDDFTTGPDFPAVEGRPLRVRYTPGEDGRARPAGYPNRTGPITFGVCLLAMAVLVFLLYRESEEAYRPLALEGLARQDD